MLKILVLVVICSLVVTGALPPAAAGPAPQVTVRCASGWLTGRGDDALQGTVTLEREQPYVFTELRRPAGADHDMSVIVRHSLNRAVAGVRAVHVIERFQSQGTMNIVPTVAGHPDGTWRLRFVYPRPGNENSTLRVWLDLADGNVVEVWGNVPVNGITFTERTDMRSLPFLAAPARTGTLTWAGPPMGATPAPAPAPWFVPEPAPAPEAELLPGQALPTPRSASTVISRPAPVPAPAPVLALRSAPRVTPASASRPVATVISRLAPVPAPAPRPAPGAIPAAVTTPAPRPRVVPPPPPPAPVPVTRVVPPAVTAPAPAPVLQPAVIRLPLVPLFATQIGLAPRSLVIEVPVPNWVAGLLPGLAPRPVSPATPPPPPRVAPAVLARVPDVFISRPVQAIAQFLAPRPAATVISRPAPAPAPAPTPAPRRGR